MKTLTIRLDAVDTAFDIPGVKYYWHCPQRRGRRHWRVFPHGVTNLVDRVNCVLRDVLDHGVTEIEIITMDAPRPAEPAQGDNAPSVSLACELYEAVLAKLSNPPDDTAAYRVCLKDVQNERGEYIYPKRARPWPYGVVSIGRGAGKTWRSELWNLHNLPRDVPNAKAKFSWPTPPPLKVEPKDFEKLEKRVAALEFSNRQRAFEAAVKAPYGTARYRKDSPSYFIDMYGSDPRTVDMYRFGDDSKLLIDRWNWGTVDAVKVAPKLPPKLDYRKMVLRIHESGIAGLCLPATAPHAGRASEGHGYFLKEVPALAKKLRELKVRELTLRRKHSGVKMERMTEWLTAIVNASSPVMKIISDPEPLK